MSLKIKLTSVMVDNHGVIFTMPPTKLPQVSIAVFADTCGNLIQIYQAPR